LENQNVRVPLLYLSYSWLLKYQNSLALILSGFHDSGNRDARIPLLCLSCSRLLKYRNAENSRRLINGSQRPPALQLYLFPTTNLLATPLDPTTCGISRLPSRVLHRPFRSSRSPLGDLHSVKVNASPSNRVIYGLFHCDPMLDDILPPELLLTLELEDLLSL